MKSLNVLIVNPSFGDSAPRTDRDIIRQIGSVGPGIIVRDATELVAAELRDDFSGKQELDKLLAWAEVIYGLLLPKDLPTRAPNLKWVQMMSAGVDRLTRNEIWQSPVLITGVSGIHATPISEFVLLEMLMFAKNAPRFFRMKEKRDWRRFPVTVLRSRTVGIVGLGAIGREVARLAKAFGMNVIATRRSTKKAGRARYVDSLLPPGQLSQLMSQSDFVVIATPLTPETRALIGEKALRAMKPTAFIINIARGGIIDEPALIRAIDEKWIAGAGLDVASAEPLPPDSRLWGFDNVILSPHISGGMDDYIKKATGLFCENLKRYLEGKKLLNLVDRRRGY
jgi:phosphoglycerate dehydrogenase-like enzyme